MLKWIGYLLGIDDDEKPKIKQQPKKVKNEEDIDVLDKLIDCLDDFGDKVDESIDKQLKIMNRR